MYHFADNTKSLFGNKNTSAISHVMKNHLTRLSDSVRANKLS